MKPVTFKQALVRLCTLAALGFIAGGFTTPAGLDSYEIYLNNKLIVQQFVNQPLSLRKLQLSTANDNDELRIHYKHCTLKGAGTGRNIILKDQRGHVVKKWEFPDVGGPDTGMVLPVKALRQLEKRHAGDDLSLHYTAHEHPQGEMLAALRF